MEEPKERVTKIRRRRPRQKKKKGAQIEWVVSFADPLPFSKTPRKRLDRPFIWREVEKPRYQVWRDFGLINGILHLARRIDGGFSVHLRVKGQVERPATRAEELWEPAWLNDVIITYFVCIIFRWAYYNQFIPYQNKGIIKFNSFW